MIKITQIKICPFAIQFAKVATQAAFTRSSRHGIAIEIYDQYGQKGLGEASPFAPISQDTVEGCYQVLSDIASQVNNLPHIDTKLPINILISNTLHRWSLQLAYTPAALFALETAICHLLAQHHSCSVTQILCGNSGHQTLEVNGLIDAKTPMQQWISEIERLLERSISTCKIKVGRHSLQFEEEVHALDLVKAHIGNTMHVRLDANAAWSIKQAQHNLSMLVNLHPQFVEQPVKSNELVSLGRCDVPWAADESLINEANIEPLLDADSCAAFVIKPTMVGGLIRSLKLAQKAQHHRIPVVVTHAFEGPIGYAAACELAMALPQHPMACGLDGYAILEAIAPGMTFRCVQNGTITPTSKIGLRCLPDPFLNTKYDSL